MLRVFYHQKILEKKKSREIPAPGEGCRLHAVFPRHAGSAETFECVGKRAPDPAAASAHCAGGRGGARQAGHEPRLPGGPGPRAGVTDSSWGAGASPALGPRVPHPGGPRSLSLCQGLLCSPAPLLSPARGGGLAMCAQWGPKFVAFVKKKSFSEGGSPPHVSPRASPTLGPPWNLSPLSPQVLLG